MMVKNKILIQENIKLKTKINEQNKLIADMREVLRFCSLNNTNIFHQREAAKEMLLNNRIIKHIKNTNDNYNYEKWIIDTFGKNIGSQILNHKQ